MNDSFYLLISFRQEYMRHTLGSGLGLAAQPRCLSRRPHERLMMQAVYVVKHEILLERRVLPFAICPHTENQLPKNTMQCRNHYETCLPELCKPFVKVVTPIASESDMM